MLADKGFFPAAELDTLLPLRLDPRRPSRGGQGAGRRSLDRRARPRSIDRHGARAGLENVRQRYPGLRRHRRRRDQRRLGLGGGDVGGQAPARQPHRDDRLQQDPVGRPDRATIQTSSPWPTSGAPSALPSTRSTATTSRPCARCCAGFRSPHDKPSAIVCHTVKGKGVAFAENDPDWHHKIEASSRKSSPTSTRPSEGADAARLHRHDLRPRQARPARRLHRLRPRPAAAAADAGGDARPLLHGGRHRAERCRHGGWPGDGGLHPLRQHHRHASSPGAATSRSRSICACTICRCG